MNTDEKTFIVASTVRGYEITIKCAKIENVDGKTHLINSKHETVGIFPSEWAVYETLQIKSGI
jgi:hypothetical protein